MIALTDEQRTAVANTENILLSACPGSGKTRVILAKLLGLAEEVADTPRLVACITYTNAAVDEIEQRLRVLGNQSIVERTEVATIHSFCLHHILRPYRWLAPEIPVGFRILTPQMSDFENIVTTVEDEFGRQVTFQTFEDYSGIRMQSDGSPTGTGLISGVVTANSAARFWELMRRKGYIDFSMILYYSLQILRNHPFVATGMSCRFKWLLVDEYQDTTDVQIDLLRELAAIKETSFFLVGDPNQSIQSFAGARTDLSEEFATEVGARSDLSLSGNFRSSANIVRQGESIIRRVPSMIAIGPTKLYSAEPIYVHVDNAVEAITDHFLPLLEEHGIPVGQAAVLAPWWQHLIPIARTLRGFDVPVFGPGARPYKKTRLFAGLAEQLGACAVEGDLLGLPGVERAIFRLVSEAEGETRFDVFSYEGRRTALSLVYEAKRISQQVMGGVDWLRLSVRACADILVNDGWVRDHTDRLLVQSVEDMLDDMQRNSVDIANMQIADLGLFAHPEKALKLSTLHHSKGREYQAVAMVHLNDGQLPHFASRSAAQIDEARRLFYVGATRAKKILLFASDNSNRRNPPCRFLSECGLRR